MYVYSCTPSVNSEGADAGLRENAAATPDQRNPGAVFKSMISAPPGLWRSLLSRKEHEGNQGREEGKLSRKEGYRGRNKGRKEGRIRNEGKKDRRTEEQKEKRKKRKKR
jgi:hypothetical protein